MDIETAVKIAKSINNPEFSCPHCDESYDIFEPDVSQLVISYHGEDPHDFTCGQCGEDFIVKEIVCRSFETARNLDELE